MEPKEIKPDNDVTKLRALILKLSNAKVDIMKDKNTVKSTYEVLNELSKEWPEITEKYCENAAVQIQTTGRSTVVYILDKDNKQELYKYIARDMNGKLRIGWVVVEQPWYSAESEWTYWLYSDEYVSGGFCDECTDLGLIRIEVQPETIKPCTQIEIIKHDLELGFKVELQDEQRNVVAIINSIDEIPYELWEE